MASTFNVLINTFLPQYQGKVICAVKYTISLRVPWFSSKFCSLLLPAAFSPACWNLNVNPMNRTHKYAKQKTQNLTCPTSELDLFQCSVNPTPNNSEKQNQWLCLHNTKRGISRFPEVRYGRGISFGIENGSCIDCISEKTVWRLIFQSNNLWLQGRVMRIVSLSVGCSNVNMVSPVILISECFGLGNKLDYIKRLVQHCF